MSDEEEFAERSPPESGSDADSWVSVPLDLPPPSSGSRPVGLPPPGSTAMPVDLPAPPSTGSVPGGPPRRSRIRLSHLLIVGALVGLGIGLAVYLPDDGDGVGTIGSGEGKAVWAGTSPTDGGTGSIAGDAGSETSESTATQGSEQGREAAPSVSPITIAGLTPAASTLRAGQLVEVAVTGVDPDTALTLLVDGEVVASGLASEGLTWTALAGTHDLTVGVVNTATISEPLTVDVPAQEAERLQPVSAVATNERDAVPRLRCGGRNSFEAELLIDGDVDTGWGASRGDGRGESIVLDFGRQVIVERVGLSPGYLRVAPRASNDCQPTLAFEFNRFVDRVEYRFDDGSTVVQDFVRKATIQEMPIAPVSTRQVTILIASTSRQVEDDDTVLSEAVFYGRPA